MANTTGRKFGGRKKGTPNKDTATLREKINNLLEDQWETVLSDMRKLSPKERIDTYTRLMEYSLPKLSRTEVRELTSLEDFVAMSPQERQLKIMELKKQINEKS